MVNILYDGQMMDSRKCYLTISSPSSSKRFLSAPSIDISIREEATSLDGANYDILEVAISFDGWDVHRRKPACRESNEVHV